MMNPDVRLIHGDCLEVMREIPENSIDVVLTDPPFSSGTRKEGQKGVRKAMVRSMEDDDWFATDCLTTHGFLWLMRQNALRWKRLLKRGGHALVFIDWRMSPHLSAAIESADFRQQPTLIWDKTYFGMGAFFRNQYELVLHFTNGRGRDPQRRDVGNVLSCAPIRDGSHPNEKPVPLLREILSVVTPPGGRVLDPFMGSGSVGVAAVRLEMSFTGIDIDPEFVEVARDRIVRPPGALSRMPTLFDVTGESA
jgi:site-specific DNA-methyltransferase (adenine-specific)